MYYRSRGTQQFVIYVLVVLLALVIGLLIGATYPEEINTFFPSLGEMMSGYFDTLFGSTVESVFATDEIPTALPAESTPIPTPTVELVPVPAGSELLPPRPTPQTCVVRSGYETGTINIRSGPGHNFAVVGTAQEGDVLTYTGEENAEGWAPILTEDGVRGYFYIPSWCE